MSFHTEFKAFWEFEFSAYCESKLADLKQRIAAEKQDYILNVNEGEFVVHLASDFAIEPLVLYFDRVEVSSREQMIPAEHFPPGFYVVAGKAYCKSIISYHIPVSGDLQLLRAIPNPRVLMTHILRLEAGSVSFEITDFYGDATQIKRDADNIIDTLRQQSTHLGKNVAAFNLSLQGQAETFFKSRKEELLKRSNTLASLGVPIRKSGNIPPTFAVPAQRTSVLPRPVATGSPPPRSPDPTMDETIYQEILQTIHETGKVFERLPRTYADKDEEALRDHLILQLEPRFEYSTTGETFNKSGKTDILVRHEKSNIFVAECKFWSGGKNHLETINQILNYLTWRDSKTAIIYFMQTKEMAAPLKAMEDVTPQHSCFVKLNSKKSASWSDYTFHLPGDTAIPIRLTILCFHLPKP